MALQLAALTAAVDKAVAEIEALRVPPPSADAADQAAIDALTAKLEAASAAPAPVTPPAA